MSNLTDALIAAKLVGGSGGSGGGSGLPEITTETTTIFAEQSVEFVAQEGTYGTDALNIVFVLGETYTVTWDGTDYTCTAFNDGDGGVAVGNPSIYEIGADTGEPFFISYDEGDSAYAGTLSTAASHTIGITQSVQSPADGAALVVKGGAWAVQEGYGYVDDGVTKPISPALSGYALIVNLTADANASSGYVADCTWMSLIEATQTGRTIVLHDPDCTLDEYEWLKLTGWAVPGVSNAMFTGFNQVFALNGTSITSFSLRGTVIEFTDTPDGNGNATVESIIRGCIVPLS